MIRRLERFLLRLLLGAFALTEEPNACRLHSDCAEADSRARRCGYQPEHHCRPTCECGDGGGL